MIQNERQYKITQTKLNDLLLDRAALDLPDPDLHPRPILDSYTEFFHKEME